VVRFDVGNSHRAPIVVIRSPEMGLQPSLMCPYLSFLLKALSAASSQLAAEEAKRAGQVVVARGEWSQDEYKGELWEEGDEAVYKDGKKRKKWDIWEWPLRISQFGAQGSTSALEGHRPGSIVTVVGSLFVGVEIAGDIGVTARDGKRAGVFPGPKKDFVYEHPVDGTEDDPHWQAPEQPGSQQPHSYGSVKGGKTDTHAYAVISLCSPSGVYDFLRYDVRTYYDLAKIRAQFGLAPVANEAENHSPLPDRISSAQDIAAAVFRSQFTAEGRARLRLQERTIDEGGPFTHFEDGIGPNDTLAEVLAKLMQAYTGRFFQREENRDGVITLTVSYFGGDEDKKAADALGIKGVAMEDYHVIRVLRSALAKGVLEDSDYPIVLGWRVDRINCDPKSLPAGVEETFNNFYRTSARQDEGGAPRGLQSLLTVDDYVKVIIWGLRGVLRKDISDNPVLKNAVNWKYLDDRTLFPSVDDLKTYFWSFVHAEGGDGFWVPDPFCIEIATDFVNELAEMSPGIEGLNEESKKKRIRKLAAAVQEAWAKEDSSKPDWGSVYNSASPTGTAARARELVRYLQDECGLAIDNHRGETCTRTWLRPRKWSGGKIAATLQDAANNKQFKAAAIDRAFYKSSNMMALQTYADHGLWQ
jgi:hypothetical protein